jgi:nucleoside-diphosphate-sugar epimerase
MLIDRNIGIYDTIGNGKCNLVYIDDLISALLLALTHEKAAGEAFNIIGPDVVSWNEFLNFFNQSLMLPPIKIIGKSTAGLKASALMPVRKMGGIVRDHFMGPIKKIAEIVPIADYMLRKVEHTLKTTPATDDLRLFNKKSYYIDRKAKAILGYSPTVSITDGLSLSAEWLFHQAVHNLQ